MSIKEIQALDSALVIVLIGLFMAVGGGFHYILAGAFGLLLALRIPVFWKDKWDETSSKGWAWFGVTMTVVLIIIQIFVLIAS